MCSLFRILSYVLYLNWWHTFRKNNREKCWTNIHNSVTRINFPTLIFGDFPKLFSKENCLFPFLHFLMIVTCNIAIGFNFEEKNYILSKRNTFFVQFRNVLNSIIIKIREKDSRDILMLFFILYPSRPFNPKLKQIEMNFLLVKHCIQKDLTFLKIHFLFNLWTQFFWNFTRSFCIIFICFILCKIGLEK